MINFHRAHVTWAAYLGGKIWAVTLYASPQIDHKSTRLEPAFQSEGLEESALPRRTASDKLFQVLFVPEVGGADAVGTKDMEASEREKLPFPISCRETCGFIQCF